VLALPLTAAAQSGATAVPDAGSVTRQIETSRPATPAPQALPTVADRPPPPRPGAATVAVTTFVLRGHTALDEAVLQAALAPWRDTPLDYAGLQSAADRVATVYQAHGRMATASLRRQDVTDGVVAIDILEARFAGARIGGRAPSRVAPDRLLAMVAAQLSPGALLDTDAMNRALMLMDDLPGVAVSGSLAAGRKPGDTELVLEVADESPTVQRAQLDNSGGRAVGAERLNLQFGLSSPLGLGDHAQLSVLASAGSRYARLGYGLPVGHRGMRLQGWVSHVDYRVVSPELKALQARGHSSTVGSSGTWPLVRSRLVNLNATLTAEARHYHNSANGSASSHYQARSMQAELSGNLFDGWGGGGANSGTLSLTSGQVKLDGSPNQAADAQSARTAGAYRRWNLQLTRQQNLPADASLYIGWSMQRGSRNLDSSERMSLGGLNGVRAYPASEAGGTHGQLLSLELRHRTLDQLVLTGFYDLGRIQVYARPWSPGGQSLLDAGAPNRYRLEGAGIAASWLLSPAVQLQATLARPIGRHPSPSASGTHQDGSNPGTRVWLSASFTL